MNSLYIKKLWSVLCVCLCCLSCDKSPKCLTELDHAIELRPIYDRQHRDSVDLIEQKLLLIHEDAGKFALYGELFELFKCHDIDSAAFYAEKMFAIDQNVYSVSARAFVFSARRNYNRAIELLDNIQRNTITDKEKLVLYDTYQSVCSAANNESGLSDSERKSFSEKKIQCQCNSLQLDCLSSFDKYYYNGRLLASKGQWLSAIEMLELALNENPLNQKAVHCTYAIANCRKELGQMEAYLEILCETAILDFKVSNKQYSSLYNIAQYLYSQNDFRRAADYIQVTILDAIQCNYSTRIINAVDVQRIITAARLQRDRNLKTALYVGIFILVGFCLVAIFQYLRIKRRNRQIKAINQRVKKLNQELNSLNKCLQEEGVIKDRCLFRYMSLTAKFIDNIEDYRHLLLETLKEEGVEALKEKLRCQDYLYMQSDAFYRLFDEIFLSIFPDFINKVNSRLPDGEKYELKKDGSFPTELRILAVIRLGITKSSRIAEFLNCPQGSVYTNKNILKTKLGCEGNSLEDLLLSL